MSIIAIETARAHISKIVHMSEVTDSITIFRLRRQIQGCAPQVLLMHGKVVWVPLMVNICILGHGLHTISINDVNHL